MGPPAEPAAPPPRTLGLTSDRACVETNLARKGLWRSASGAEAEGGELVRLLDATDQLGMVQRIDTTGRRQQREIAEARRRLRAFREGRRGA